MASAFLGINQTGYNIANTGAVVGKNDVLTASHAVYSVPDGGLADEIRFYPGRDGASIPLGPYYGGQVNYFEVDPDGDGTLTARQDIIMLPAIPAYTMTIQVPG